MKTVLAFVGFAIVPFAGVASEPMDFKNACGRKSIVIEAVPGRSDLIRSVYREGEMCNPLFGCGKRAGGGPRLTWGQQVLTYDCVKTEGHFEFINWSRTTRNGAWTRDDVNADQTFPLDWQPKAFGALVGKTNPKVAEYASCLCQLADKGPQERTQ